MEPEQPRRTPIRSYEDLEVYQRGMALMRETNAFVRGLPDDERKRLGDQMQRASRSVPTNVAEGWGRRASPREFKRFLTISMGSANEMEVHYKVARDLGFGTDPECQRLIGEYQVVGKQLRRLIERWRPAGSPPSTLHPPVPDNGGGA